MNRRGFLTGILAAATAPAIVRADSLMRIVPRETVLITGEFNVNVPVLRSSNKIVYWRPDIEPHWGPAQDIGMLNITVRQDGNSWATAYRTNVLVQNGNIILVK